MLVGDAAERWHRDNANRHRGQRGTGKATVCANSTRIARSGTNDDCDFDSEEQLFGAEGEYQFGEETAKLELQGSCTSA